MGAAADLDVGPVAVKCLIVLRASRSSIELAQIGLVRTSHIGFNESLPIKTSGEKTMTRISVLLWAGVTAVSGLVSPGDIARAAEPRVLASVALTSPP